MATKKTKKKISYMDKLKANGLTRLTLDVTELTKKSLWTANEQKRYTSTDEYKPFLESLVNALARHKNCEDIIAGIMSGEGFKVGK